MIDVQPQQDGTQVWVYTHPDTGEQLTYRYVPVANLTPGTRLNSSRQFVGRGHGRGTRQVPGRVLNAPDVDELQSKTGSFVRIGEDV